MSGEVKHPLVGEDGGGKVPCIGDSDASQQNQNSDESRKKHPGRSRLPVPQPEKVQMNLISYLKQCVGKELTKITMPVHWNEPLSLLQRISEYMNYSHVLLPACQVTDPVERLELVATFAVSALASNLDRMGKPFNPLLGETYQLEQEHFKFFCEQVCHHPPVSAFHASSNNQEFVFHGSIYPKVKFWGKSIEFQPKGVMTVELPLNGERYTWSNVNCVVHNLIVGTLWMEHTGTMEVVCHNSGLKAVLNFRPGGWFSGTDDLHTVEGFIIDKNKQKLRFLYGRWTEFLCSADPEMLASMLNCTNLNKIDPSASNLPKHPPLPLGAVPGSKILWEADPKPEHSSLYYNFSSFTMKLNEAGQGGDLAPTDCRNRPDIRALEEGDLEAAAMAKEKLENKQREARKPFKNKKENEWWSPRWFVREKHPDTGDEIWKSNGKFWSGEYDHSLDIF